MASVDDCRQALHDLSARLEAKAAEIRDKVNLDRTLACRISDLNVAFHGRISNGRLIEIADGDNPDAKLALTTTSDDLIALVHGQLDVSRAIASRRMAISASPFDLIKLRKLL